MSKISREEPQKLTTVSAQKRWKSSLARLDSSQERTDLVDLAQIWATIRRNYRLLFGIAFSIFAGAMLLTLASAMEFQSSARLYLGELEKSRTAASPAPGEFDMMGTGQGDIGSEMEIIKSRTLIDQAVLASGLNVTLMRAGETKARYWRWLLSERDPQLVDVALREVRVVNARLSPVYREAHSYTLSFLDSDEYEVSTSDGVRLGRGKLGVPIRTRDFTATFQAGFSSKPRPGSKFTATLTPLGQVTDEVLKKLKVTAPTTGSSSESVNVVTLAFATYSPRLAATFLEQLMHAYLKARQVWKTEDASAAEEFVTNQLHAIQFSLDDVQKKLAQYRTNHRTVVLDTEAKVMIEQIAKYEEQRVAARLQVAALTDIKRSLAAPGAPMGAYLLGEAKDTVLEGMAEALSEARRELTRLETRFSESAPDVRKQRVQVEAQLAAVRNYVNSRLARAQESLNTLNGIIAQFEQKLATVPTAELGLAQLARESEVYSRTYSYLLERQQQAGIVKASTLSKNRVLDEPLVPEREHSPRILLRSLSAIAGLLFGAVWVLVRSLLSPTIESEADAHRVSRRVPVLATVPRRPRSIRARKRAALYPSFDVPVGAPDYRFVEAFRAIRANLDQLGGRTGSVILVTSPSPGDGKTTCVQWLASALAADRRRVLVVDADLRKLASSVDKETPVLGGLLGVLSGDSAWEQELRRVSLSSGAYQLLPAGGNAPPEVLSNANFSQFLREARESFDVILIDSPSFPFVSDALVLAASADIVLGVIGIQNSSRKSASEHIARLSALTPCFATVINDAGRSSSTVHHAVGDSVPPGTLTRSRVQRRWWVAAVLTTLGVASWVFLAEQPEPNQTPMTRRPSEGAVRGR